MPIRLYSRAIISQYKIKGYKKRCKFAVTQNIVQKVAQFCNILRLTLLTHVQSIGVQHLTGKQEVELCCSPHGAVLYGGCPERYPCFAGTL